MYNSYEKYSKINWIAFLFVSFILIRVSSIFFAPHETVSAYDSLNSVASINELDDCLKNNIKYSVGDEATSRDAKLIVNSVTKSNGFLLDKPSENCEFIVINVSIENVGKSIVSYNPFDFTLTGKDDIIKTYRKIKGSNSSALANGKLSPGEKISGDIIFEQKKDTSELILGFTSNIFSSDTAFVKLN